MSRRWSFPGRTRRRQSEAVNGASTGLGSTTGGANGVSVTKEARQDVDMSPLIQLITTSVAPGTWQVQDSTGQNVSSAYGLGGGFGGGAGRRGESTTTVPRARSRRST